MKKAAFVVMVLVVAAGPLLAFAQGGGSNPPGGGGENPGSSITLKNPLGSASTPVELLNRILTFILEIGGVIAAIMIIIGAFQILFAGGDPEKFSVGKRTIIYVAIAYGILLMAKGIVLIIKDFFTVTP
jgi:hypothetical protein